MFFIAALESVSEKGYVINFQLLFKKVMIEMLYHLLDSIFLLKIYIFLFFYCALIIFVFTKVTAWNF